MGSCSDITKGVIAAKCGVPPTAGTEAKVVLLNHSQVDRLLSTQKDGVLTDLILTDGSKGYEFESLDNATLGEYTLNKGTFFSNWQHDLTLRIFAKNQDCKNFVNSLNGAKVVAVVANKELGESGDVKYEVYGFDAGLELNEAAGTTEMQDNIVYTLKLGSGENSKEAGLPLSLFKEDLTTTEKLVEALTADKA